MLSSLFYEDKGTLLQTLHTASLLFYLGVLFAASLVFSHPLYLLGVFGVAVLGVVAAGALEKWELYLRAGIWMALLVLLINPLASRAGETLLWKAGPVRISLESICYGAAMGVRLLATLTIFCLASATVHPDRLLALVSRFAFRSALVASLATRMLPRAARDLEAAWEVLQLRAGSLKAGGLKARLEKLSLLFGVLLTSSLEGALQAAEAMQARAYGSGPRSSYRRERVRPRDLFCLGAASAAACLLVAAKVSGQGDYVYYPRLGALLAGPESLVLLLLLVFSLAVVPALSWGWKCWPSLRSKI